MMFYEGRGHGPSPRMDQFYFGVFLWHWLKQSLVEKAMMHC